MEFKKPTRYNKEQPNITPLQRGYSTPMDNGAAQKTTKSPISKKKSISKRVHLDLLPVIQVFLPRARCFLLSKKGIVTSILVLVVIGAFTTGVLARQRSITKSSNLNVDPKEVVENLEYQTVLPEGKSISQIGGWRRVSPPKTDPVYAYNDTIGGVSINVSQQPLPQSFKDDVDNKIAELAKAGSYTTKINAKGTNVYIGISAKGPQSAIFTKNGLLILIKSDKRIDDATWAKYINSLN